MRAGHFRHEVVYIVQLVRTASQGGLNGAFECAAHCANIALARSSAAPKVRSPTSYSFSFHPPAIHSSWWSKLLFFVLWPTKVTLYLRPIDWLYCAARQP